MMDTSLATGLQIATFGIVVGAMLAYVIKLNDRLREQDRKIAVLETQLSPLWARVQAQISSDLHHPHERYLEMDTLLEKLEALKITDPERRRLKELLEERSRDMHEDITEEQRKKAQLMIQVMDLVVIEAKTVSK
jgi:hypothetical protein